MNIFNSHRVVDPNDDLASRLSEMARNGQIDQISNTDIQIINNMTSERRSTLYKNIPVLLLRNGKIPYQLLVENVPEQKDRESIYENGFTILFENDHQLNNIEQSEKKKIRIIAIQNFQGINWMMLHLENMSGISVSHSNINDRDVSIRYRNNTSNSSGSRNIFSSRGNFEKKSYIDLTSLELDLSQLTESTIDVLLSILISISNSGVQRVIVSEEQLRFFNDLLQEDNVKAIRDTNVDILIKYLEGIEAIFCIDDSEDNSSMSTDQDLVEAMFHRYKNFIQLFRTQKNSLGYLSLPINDLDQDNAIPLKLQNYEKLTETYLKNLSEKTESIKTKKRPLVAVITWDFIDKIPNRAIDHIHLIMDEILLDDLDRISTPQLGVKTFSCLSKDLFPKDIEAIGKKFPEIRNLRLTVKGPEDLELFTDKNFVTSLKSFRNLTEISISDENEMEHPEIDIIATIRKVFRTVQLEMPNLKTSME